MEKKTATYGYREPLRKAVEVFDMLPEGTRAEVLNNILYMPPTPSFEHQDISMDISAQIFSLVKRLSLGKVVCTIDTYLDENNAVQPDILFIANENLDIIQDGKVRGVPDLIIEILSPGNRKYDLKLKKDRYEAAGVKEYFAIDQKTKEVFGFRLEGKKYISMDITKQSILSKVLGTEIKF
jgi:Uma2 family endonuclease